MANFDINTAGFVIVGMFIATCASERNRTGTPPNPGQVVRADHVRRGSSAPRTSRLRSHHGAAANRAPIAAALPWTSSRPVR
jgi:hypothetical protein